jgi:hypothetical protein
MRKRDGQTVCFKRCFRVWDKTRIEKFRAEFGADWKEVPNPTPRPIVDPTPAILECPSLGRMTVAQEYLLELEGVDLSSARLELSSDESITFSAPTFDVDGSAASFTVSGSTPGTFDLLVNGKVYKSNFFKVRS